MVIVFTNYLLNSDIFQVIFELVEGDFPVFVTIKLLHDVGELVFCQIYFHVGQISPELPEKYFISFKVTEPLSSISKHWKSS